MHGSTGMRGARRTVSSAQGPAPYALARSRVRREERPAPGADSGGDAADAARAAQVCVRPRCSARPTSAVPARRGGAEAGRSEGARLAGRVPRIGRRASAAAEQNRGRRPAPSGCPHWSHCHRHRRQPIRRLPARLHRPWARDGRGDAGACGPGPPPGPAHCPPGGDRPVTACACAGPAPCRSPAPCAACAASDVVLRAARASGGPLRR